MASKPKKDSLRERMLAHIDHHQNSDTVNLIWKGYLAALMEWGPLQPDEYYELNGLLPDVGETERRELFLGFPGQYE